MTDVKAVNQKRFLSQAEWCMLPAEQRIELGRIFKVTKSGQVKVQSTPMGDRLVSDGTEPEDLMRTLNIENVLAMLGYEPKENDIFDFDLLFASVMSKLFGGAAVPVAPVEPEPEEVAEEEVKDTKPKKMTVSQKKKK